MAIVLLVAGCQQGSIDNAGESQNDQAQDKDNEEQIELDLWHFDPGERQEVYLEAIERFEDEHPNVTVNELLIPNDDYKQRIVVSMSGKDRKRVGKACEDRGR